MTLKLVTFKPDKKRFLVDVGNAEDKWDCAVCLAIEANLWIGGYVVDDDEGEDVITLKSINKKGNYSVEDVDMKRLYQLFRCQEFYGEFCGNTIVFSED